MTQTDRQFIDALCCVQSHDHSTRRYVLTEKGRQNMNLPRRYDDKFGYHYMTTALQVMGHEDEVAAQLIADTFVINRGTLKYPKFSEWQGYALGFFEPDGIDENLDEYNDGIDREFYFVVHPNDGFSITLKPSDYIWFEDNICVITEKQIRCWYGHMHDVQVRPRNGKLSAEDLAWIKSEWERNPKCVSTGCVNRGTHMTHNTEKGFHMKGYRCDTCDPQGDQR